MISIRRDKNDKGPRKRLLLSIGDYHFHLSEKEAKRLRARLNRFKLR